MTRFRNPGDLRKAEVALAEADPLMSQLISEHGPCTIAPWSRDLFTSLASSIVSQQLSVKAASTIFKRFKSQCAVKDIISPALLLSTSVDDLRGCGLSQAKVRYCLALADAVVSQKLDLNDLVNHDDETIIKELIKIPGIGRWTAEMFLVFAVGATDVLATADLGLRRGMQRYLDLDVYPSDELFIAKAAVWRPYRSLASWYLWRLAE